MDDSEKSPYFSKRVRIADIKSPKECLGMKERTIEVTIGNTEKPITFKNPQDVAEITHQNLKEMLLELFRITDEIAADRDFKFVDQYKKETTIV